MHIPVNIEVGCMALVILPLKRHNTDVIGKWCKVIEVFDNSIRIKEAIFKVPIYAIEFFTFGSIGIPNPEFNLEQVLKIK